MPWYGLGNYVQLYTAVYLTNTTSDNFDLLVVDEEVVEGEEGEEGKEAGEGAEGGEGGAEGGEQEGEKPEETPAPELEKETTEVKTLILSTKIFCLGLT